MKLNELLERLENINLSYKHLKGNLIEASKQFGWGITVPGNFICDDNLLTSLEGMPENVIGTIDCSNNALTDLNHCSLSVGGGFICRHNQITTLEFTPKYIRGDFDCSDNKIIHLKDIETSLGTLKGKMILSNNPISAHITGLLKIKGLEEVVFKNPGALKAEKAFAVLNKYLMKTESINEEITPIIANFTKELKEKGLEDFL